jgi:hypothetical protein
MVWPLPQARPGGWWAKHEGGNGNQPVERESERIMDRESGVMPGVIRLILCPGAMEGDGVLKGTPIPLVGTSARES